jgi:hypothetical protein
LFNNKTMSVIKKILYNQTINNIKIHASENNFIPMPPDENIYTKLYLPGNVEVILTEYKHMCLL